MTELKVLAGSDEKLKQGQHVDSQGYAKDKGFSRVSSLWYTQTISYEQGMEAIEQEKRTRQDIYFDARYVKFHPGEKSISVEIDGQEFNPNEWSARQLCNWFGAPQTLMSYYKEPDAKDMEVVAHALRNGQRKYDKEKKLLFRTYQDGTLRGVLSEKYSTVDNTWYLRLLAKLIPDGRLSHWKGNADTIFGNILIPDSIREEDDSDYGGMLSIGNCELGKRVVFQTPSLFRAICMNGCVFGKTQGIELRQRHINIDLEQLEKAVKENIHKQIPLLTTGYDMMVATHKLKSEAGLSRIYAAIAKKHQLASEVALECMTQWTTNSNEATAFGVIDGITRAGQKFDAETWYKCDVIGGMLMRNDNDEWQRLNSFAKSLTDKEMNKAFGLVS